MSRFPPALNTDRAAGTPLTHSSTTMFALDLEPTMLPQMTQITVSLVSTCSVSINLQLKYSSIDFPQFSAHGIPTSSLPTT